MLLKMRKILNTLIFLLLLVSCGSKKANKTTENSTELDTMDFQQTASMDTVAQNAIVEKCACSDFKQRQYYERDLMFYKFNPDETDSLFNIYSADSLRLTIKSIYFAGFDTIPKKFAIFKNVEHIIIAGGWVKFGLDMFPNLKSIVFYESGIEVNPSDKWLSRIESIYAEKASVKLQTFKLTPNLKEIYFSHARLEPFPADFDELKCLRRITLDAYRGDIDLSKIDLSFNPCLERVEFITYYNAFLGIPQGLDTNRNFKLIIHHQKLTKEEKEIIKTFNERKKKKQQITSGLPK